MSGQALDELVIELKVWLEEEHSHGLMAEEDKYPEWFDVLFAGIGGSVDVDYRGEDIYRIT